MKIEIEVEDISLFAKAFNNACVSHTENTRALMLGCDVPKDIEPLRVLPDEELLERLRCLYNVNRQIEKIEMDIIGDIKI